MKKIIINSENRRFNISSMVIGYLEENKAEKIEFEIPKEYQNYGKKACFSANGTTFAKLFDNITSNILTITRDISQFNELDLSIEFFKTENEDEIIARTSILHIVIENAVVCEDVKPDDEKVVILNELIEKVTNLESETTKNEELRQKNEQNRIKNEEERVQYFNDIKEKVENGDFNGKDALINGVNTLEIVEGENISLQQQANVLTISNTYQYNDSEIKGDIEEIKQNLTKYSLVTETGSKVLLSINSSTYVMTLELKDKNNNTISSGEVDLPLETMVVGATYNNETKEIELTLQNGTKVSFSVADLVSGLVNEDDLNTKLQDYALKTSIPTKTSQLTNDSGFINKSVDNLDNYYNKGEVDLIKKDVEINKTDIKNLSNRTKRIETDIFDSGEATGTGINLQDSTLAEFQEVKIDGVGNQETTTGKNLANYNDSSTLFNFNIADIEADTTYTLYLNINGYQSFNLKYDYADGETIKTAYNLTGKRCITFATTKAGILYMNAYGSSSGTFKSFDEIMLVKGEYNIGNIGEFEKYTGGEPSPSPDYEQPIEVIEDDFELVSCGANLVDWSNVKPGSFNAIGKYENDILTVTSENPQTYPAISYDITNILKRYENKKLKFICEDSHVSNEDATANVQMTVVTNDSKTYYLSLYDIKTKNNTPQTILKNIKSALVGVYANNSSTAVANTSTIVKPTLFIYNNEDVNIEPYTETRQTITMPEDEFAGKIDDTYKDQFRINYNEEDGKYHLYLDKKIGKVVFNGSEDWVLRNEVVVEGAKCYRNQSVDYSIIGSITNGLSNYFRYSYTNELNTIRFIQTQGYAMQICIDENLASDTSSFKQWLSTHNTEIYYVLNEPYTLDLGVVNMPLSYYPITNVYNTCEAIPNMYVKYYRDFKKTITTMQVDIENLKEAISTLTSSQENMANNISTLQNVVSSSLEETESEGVTE